MCHKHFNEVDSNYKELSYPFFLNVLLYVLRQSSQWLWENDELRKKPSSVIVFIQLLLSFWYCFHSGIVFILLLFSFGYCCDKWSGPSGAYHVFDLKIVWDYYITSSSYIHGTKENCIAGMKVLAWSHRTKSSLVGGLEVCRGSSAIW